MPLGLSCLNHLSLDRPDRQNRPAHPRGWGSLLSSYRGISGGFRGISGKRKGNCGIGIAVPIAELPGKGSAGDGKGGEG